MNITPDELTRFLGPFHPLLIHLPIGFLFLLAGLEALAIIPRLRPATAANRTIIVLSVPATILTAVCGWFLAEKGGYDDELLVWHRWLGVAVAVAVIVLLVLHMRDRTVLYRLGLLVTLALLIWTGHFGGSMTFGRGYLTRHTPEALRPWLRLPPASLDATPASPTTLSADGPVYAGAIHPVLDKYCVACHGPEKSKGKLRVDTAEALLKGGEDGPVLVAGKSGESPMIKRLHLPAGDDDHMPPDGKLQPSPEEITLLTWWIDAGAELHKSARDLAAPADVLKLLSGATTSIPTALPTTGTPIPAETVLPTPTPTPDAAPVPQATPPAENVPGPEAKEAPAPASTPSSPAAGETQKPEAQPAPVPTAPLPSGSPSPSPADTAPQGAPPPHPSAPPKPTP